MNVETRRMQLRPVDRRDIDDLVGLDADPAVMRFVNGGQATPRTTVEDWVLPRALTEFAAGHGGMWVAVDQRYGAFLGWLWLRAPRHSNRPELELSYRLRREYWGRGLATEAARAALGLAFDEFAAGRVFASTMATHISSRRVMEKLGMRICSIHLSGGEPGAAISEVEYEVLRADWHSPAPHRTIVAADAHGLTA
ncbi:MAG: GNAT family N-acetyltransferase [Gordonia sp. (in: high G+C Gram-positive bacteria)]